MNYIYALKITTDLEATTNTDIGLYAITGENSVFRWSEFALSGTADTWKNGILKSVEEINKGGDFVNAGGVCSADGFSVTFFNTNQLTLQIKDSGISFNGLKCQIYEFVGTDADSDSYEIANVYSGICENLTWNQLTGTFNVKSSLHKRRANIATLIDSSKIVPVTFGESDPANERYFKAIRTTSVVQTLKQEDLAAGGVAGTNFLNPKMRLYPVYQMVGTSPSLIYQIRLGYMDTTALPDGAAFVGKYVLIKEGEHNIGTYRKITSATVEGSGQAIIELTFESYFENDLVGNWDGDAEHNTWLQFVDMEREYELDSAACSGFYDSDDNKIENAVELYSKADEQILKIPHYGYDVDTDNTDNNSLIMNPLLFDNTPDKMYSFSFMPMALSLYDESDLSVWDNLVESGWSNYSKVDNGVYKHDSYGSFTATTNTLSNTDNIKDKNSTTYATHELDIEVGADIALMAKVYKLSLPTIDDKLTFDKVYLCIKYESNSRYVNSLAEFRLKSRGYINRVKHIKHIDTDDRHNPLTPTYGTLIDNVPDFYWSPNTETQNENFFIEREIISSTDLDTITGYKLFDLVATTVEEYEAIEEIIMISKYTLPGNPSTDPIFDTKIYHASIMLVSQVDIKDVIYV